MNRCSFALLTFAACCLFGPVDVSGQQRTIEPDLFALAERGEIRVFNRAVIGLIDGAMKGLQLNEVRGDGVAYLPGLELANGTIEVVIRGKDVQQRSFVGLAFHGVDGTTYDAVYFRPFNFRATDPTRRARAVQYVSHPTFTWDKLRADRPGAYEQAVNSAPDPNDWFRVRVVIAGSTVSVYVGDAAEPTLVVEKLSDRGTGLVGLWVGNNAGGDFANLRIHPE